MLYFLESKLEKNIEIINKTNNNKIQADTLLEVPQTKFGFKNFRVFQLATIEPLIQHGRLLCTQPCLALWMQPAIFSGGLF